MAEKNLLILVPDGYGLIIAGIKMRRMMGYMVITLFVSLVVFGFSLLTLVPQQ
jgi:short-chain fatty acids transporter